MEYVVSVLQVCASLHVCTAFCVCSLAVTMYGDKIIERQIIDVLQLKILFLKNTVYVKKRHLAHYFSYSNQKRLNVQ